VTWWRRPKWLGPCDRLCPIEVERRIAEAGKSGPMFVIGIPTPAEVDAYRSRTVAEMRRIVATEYPPPCRRCPAQPMRTKP
jgi:hypothetical protein